MSGNLRRRLLAKRDAAIREAAEKTLAGQREDVAGLLQEIGTYDKLIAATPRDRLRQGLIAAAVGLLCVSAIGAASTFRVPETEVVLSLEGESVSLRLAEALATRADLPLHADALRLDEFDALDVPAPDAVSKRLNGSSWAQVDGGHATLNRLALEKDGLLTVETNGNGLVRLYLSGAVAAGELTVQGGAEISAGQAGAQADLRHRLESAFPETVRFHAEGGSIVPARLRIHPKQDLVLRHLPVRGLSFMRETPDDTGGIVFVSTISSGRLTLNDVSETVELGKGERLGLKGLSGRVSELRVNERISLRFEGRAEELRIGPEGFDRDLAPSLLDYLYQNQRLAFFWSAFLFLWGMLWSVRKLLFP